MHDWPRFESEYRELRDLAGLAHPAGQILVGMQHNHRGCQQKRGSCHQGQERLRLVQLLHTCELK